MKVLTRSFIMLNTMTENENKIFNNISIFSLRSWRRSWYLFSFSHDEVFSMMKLKQVKTMIRESYIAR